MSAQIDLIYERLIAEEKVKDGTEYERLAAIAFGVLTGRATVHDLRLRGASGVRHQGLRQGHRPADHPQLLGLGVTETAQLKLADADGKERDFLPIFDAQLAEDYGTVPLGGEATIGRVNGFDEPTWLIVPGVRRFASKPGSGSSRSHLTPSRSSSRTAPATWSQSSRSARSTAASAACSPTASSKPGPSTATTSSRAPDSTADLSRERQYELVERAVELGWHAAEVVVIDSDQGQSSKSTDERDGFHGLVADVGLGRAGSCSGSRSCGWRATTHPGTSCLTCAR